MLRRSPPVETSVASATASSPQADQYTTLSDSGGAPAVEDASYVTSPEIDAAGRRETAIGAGCTCRWTARGDVEHACWSIVFHH